MIRILLVGEGVRDIGRGETGPLQELMKKCIDVDLDIIAKKRDDIKHFPITNKKYDNMKLIYGRKLRGFALQEGARHIALHRDEDNKGFEKIYREVHDNFSEISEEGFNCLAIVPQHMTESWFLADDSSFPKKPKKPSLPTKPEETWGKADSSNHPKRYLENILKQFNMPNDAESLTSLARKIDIKVLVSRCPISFKKFHEDMQEFVY